MAECSHHRLGSFFAPGITVSQTTPLNNFNNILVSNKLIAFNASPIIPTNVVGQSVNAPCSTDTDYYATLHNGGPMNNYADMKGSKISSLLQSHPANTAITSLFGYTSAGGLGTIVGSVQPIPPEPFAQAKCPPDHPPPFPPIRGASIVPTRYCGLLPPVLQSNGGCIDNPNFSFSHRIDNTKVSDYGNITGLVINS